jgi:hypothetical protein
MKSTEVWEMTGRQCKPEWGQRRHHVSNQDEEAVCRAGNEKRPKWQHTRPIDMS